MADLVSPTSGGGGAAVPKAEMPALSSLLTLALCVVVVAALYLARDVLIPITLAVLLSFVLMPVVDLLRRFGLPHVAAVLLAVVLGFGIILSLAGVIGIQIAGLANDVPGYASTIGKKVETVRGATLGRLSDVMKRLDRMAPADPAKPANNETRPGPGASRNTALGNGSQPVPVEVLPPPTQPMEVARSVLAPVLGPISDLLIVIIIAVFILMQREDLRDRLIRLFGSNDLHRTTLAMDDAARRLGRYFLSQLGINTIFGVVIAIGLAIIGVPSPVLWGVMGALLRFVPYVGAIIAALLPAAVAAAVVPDWSMVVWTVALFVVVESITGQVVEPLIYGHSTGLSPVAVVVAAIFWTWIWGPIGLVLSTPLTLCLVVLGRHVDRLEFLDVLLGDRPALTPVENFYQRMLAQDPDEALLQAESLLKERSLSAYYDEVAIKGLQLATSDALRGTLPAEKVDLIKKSVRDLVVDLAERDDRDPEIKGKTAPANETRAERELPTPAAPQADAPDSASLAPAWRGAAAVLCLAGRGPLDEPAADMLAQLLGKHGLGARVLPHTAVSRDAIGSLDPAGVAMICLSYLDLGGTPSNLHYTVRRLRRRLPEVPVLVGFLPKDEDPANERRLRDVIGADYYASSLKEAVETCVTVAHEAAGLAPANDAEAPLEAPPAGPAPGLSPALA